MMANFKSKVMGKISRDSDGQSQIRFILVGKVG